jgi:hypothetical protein
MMFETYLVGRLANVILGDEQIFVNNWTKMSFEKLIHDMYDPNLEAWRIIQHVVHTLMGPPYNWITPKECYQKQPSTICNC